MQKSKNKNQNFGISFFILIASFFKPKLKPRSLSSIDFSVSTQKMGLSFADKIRSVFRHKWVRSKK